MHPIVVGLNIKNAPVEVLEALSVHHSVNKLRLNELSERACSRSALILSTCNRLEFYAVSDNPEQSIKAIYDYLDYQKNATSVSEPGSNDRPRAQVEDLGQYMYEYVGEDAVKHLYRVVSGLDSMVLGETEILGQVSRAYEMALSAGSTDKVLNRWFQKALSVGKLVRTQFGLDQYHTSVGRIAVDLAEQELGCLQQKSILILGAGEMCELTMKHLISKSCSLVMVSNRSLQKAQELADEYGFDACSLEELPHYLQSADLVFSATAAKHFLISYDLIESTMALRRERPIVFIDMAVPRDIDPRAAEIAEVSCFDIKQLRDVSDKNHGHRKQASLLVEVLIAEKSQEFLDWLAELQDHSLRDNSVQRVNKKLRKNKNPEGIAQLSRAGIV